MGAPVVGTVTVPVAGPAQGAVTVRVHSVGPGVRVVTVTGAGACSSVENTHTTAREERMKSWPAVLIRPGRLQLSTISTLRQKLTFCLWNLELEMKDWRHAVSPDGGER